MSRKRVAVALWMLGIAVAAFVIATTRFSADMSAFLPRSPTPTQEVLVDQVEKGAASHVILVAIDNAPTATLADLSKGLAARLRQNQAFTAANNGAEAAAGGAAADAEGSLIWRNRYLLSPGVTPDRFTVAGLQQALDNDVKLLSSDLAGIAKRSLAADPTGEILALIGLFTDQAQPARHHGVWFSPDGGQALLVVQTRAAGFDIAREEEALTALDHAFAEAQQAIAGAADARLRATGPGIFAVHTKTEMKEDVSRLSLIAMFLVSSVLLFAYRSPRVLVLALVPVASGALAGVTAVSLGFGFVHGITLGFGVTLIGEAVDYAIYLFTQTAPGAPPEATLPRIWSMLQLGVLTSVCGFSAMLFSSFTGFAQLGLFSITGLIVAVAVTRWVLPSLLPANFATARSSSFAAVLLALVKRASHLRIPALVATLAAFALIALHQGGLWEDDLSSLSPIPSADQKLDQELRRDVGAPDVRYVILVTASAEQQALETSERLSGMLEGLVKQGLVAGFDAANRYLPSDATQRARLDALPDPATLRARLTQALEDSPFQPDLFEPFIADVAAAKKGPLLDRATLDDSPFGLRLDALLFASDSAWTALLSLRGVTDAALVQREVARSGVDGAVFVDLKAESDKLLAVYRREAVMLAFIGSLVIVVLLTVAMRSPRRVALVVAPLAAAVIITTAILTLGSHKLSIFNLMGLLLTVAVGSNYCIFFERQDWADPYSERMVASLALANLCTVIGFGALAFSRLPVLYGIGETVAVGAFLALTFGAIAASYKQASQGLPNATENRS